MYSHSLEIPINTRMRKLLPKSQAGLKTTSKTLRSCAILDAKLWTCTQRRNARQKHPSNVYSKVIKPRRPFAMDPQLDYSVMEDEEWEPEPEGDSLSVRIILQIPHEISVLSLQIQLYKPECS